MKLPTLSIFVVLISSVTAIGQNWQLVNPDYRYHYQDENSNYISHTIFSEGFEISGDTMLTELNKVIAYCDTCDYWIDEVGCELWGEGCLWNKEQAQFAGLRIVDFPNGDSELYFDDDTLSLRRHSNVNDLWQFDNSWTIAHCTSIETMEIMGQIDSVRVIDLSPDGEIILSKSHGIVKWNRNGEPSLDLVGISGLEVGERPLDFDGVFGLEVGTILEYSTGSGSSSSSGSYSSVTGTIQMEVEAVILNEMGAVITFSFTKNVSSWSPPWEPEVSEEVIISQGEESMSYLRSEFDLQSAHGGAVHGVYRPTAILPTAWNTGNVRSQVTKHKLPDDRRVLAWGDIELLGINSNGTYFHDYFQNECQPIEAYDLFEIGGNMQMFEIATGNCLAIWSAERQLALGEGIGIVQSRIFQHWSGNDGSGGIGGSSSNNFILKGYVINGDTTGTITPQNVLLGITDAPAHLDIEVFPNPSDGQVQMNPSFPHPMMISCVDLRGRQLWQEILAPFDSHIDLSPLPQGIYILNFETPSGATSTQRLVIQ